MNEILYMIITLVVGLILGTIFFAGLWFTVKKALVSKTPAIWFIGSFIIRVTITLIGFYFVGKGNFKNLIVCLLGFIIARIVVTYYTKQKENKQIELKKEVDHEA